MPDATGQGRSPAGRHPLARLAGTIARLPRYARLARELVGDPALPRSRKLGVAAGLGYAVLPFDLVPGIIPVLGQLDDRGALLLGPRHALRGYPPEVAEARLASAGLSRSALENDLRTVAVATVWLLAGTGKLIVTAPLKPLAALNSAKGSDGRRHQLPGV